VLASGVRAAVKAWGLELCAKGNQWHSDTVSAVMVPQGFNGADVIDAAYRRYNLSLGAGLSQVAGKLFRIEVDTADPRHAVEVGTQMAAKLLANPVIEDFEVALETAAAAGGSR
jgi:aspartate aminotransferase-like enzyme